MSTNDPPSSPARPQPERDELVERLQRELEAWDDANDGGNKGYQCVGCGEWDRQHKASCTVLFYRALLAELTRLKAEQEAPPVMRIEIEEDSASTFYASYTRGFSAEHPPGQERGAADASSTVIGALANLIAVLIKVEEDKVHERSAAGDQARKEPT